jgi:hypothetical protein
MPLDNISLDVYSISSKREAHIWNGLDIKTNKQTNKQTKYSVLAGKSG